jgi:transcriptional regulator with XRE-family HTH domain
MGQVVARSYPLGDISATGNLPQLIPQGNLTLGNILRMTKKPIREVLAANIRRYMRSVPAVDTQVKLAKRAGISQSSVARVLAGNVDTQVSIVESLASAIGVSAAELLEDATDAKASLHYDRARFASLPAVEQAKITSYIDFVLSQASDTKVEADGSLSVTRKTAPTKQQQLRAGRVAQRQLSNESLGIDETHNDTTRKRGPGKRSG